MRRDLDLDVGYHARRWQGPEMADVGRVSTRRTPCIARTRPRSPILKRACACGERTTTACSWLRHNIGDVTPCTTQKRVVFLARERLAESELHCHCGRQLSSVAWKAAARGGTTSVPQSSG